MNELISKTERIISKLENFDEDIILEKFFEEEGEYIEELNKERLGKGEYTDGTLLDDYSSGSMAHFDKPTDSNPYYDSSGADAIRLYDTGDFYDSITTEYDGDDLHVYSADDFGSDLVDNYGEETLGLTDEDMQSMKIDLKRAFEQYFKDIND